MAQLESRALEQEKAEAALAEIRLQYDKATEELRVSREHSSQLEQGEGALKDKIAKVTEDNDNQLKLIAKLREVGRKHRDQSKAASKTVEEQKTEIAELKKKLEEGPAVSKEPSPSTTNELAEKIKVGWIFLDSFTNSMSLLLPP